MPKLRSGYAYQDPGGWWARVTYTDGLGKRKNIKRRAENKTEAKLLIKQILRELDNQGEGAQDAARMTFNQLASYYEKQYLIEPQYVDGRKVAGLRSYKTLICRLNFLREFFSKKRLRDITSGDLERYKTARINTPIIVGRNTRKTENEGKPKSRQRSIATVHRELSLLRRVLNIAIRNGWLIRNPFQTGDTMINPADEKPRERILTRTEEEKLLSVCIGLRAHVRPIIIAALDTGMRRGEILKLKWSDVDFENRIIIIRAFNTKTMRERQVAITQRLAGELEALYELSTKELDQRVFGIYSNVKKGFNTARRLAGLPDVRFHDLRHTHATRLVSAHIPLSEVGRVLGHTQANTTYRYVNANVETARRAAAILDEFNRAEDKTQVIH